MHVLLVWRGQVVEGADGFIGSGSLGEVRLGRWRGVEVALKSLRAINHAKNKIADRIIPFC